MPVPILFSDDRLVVVNKPAGLIVHRGWAQDREVLMTLVRDLVDRYVYPVHRLDRGASGVVLFALDRQMASELGRAQQERRIHKRYLALVRGRPSDSGVIESPLAADKHSEPKPARTSYRRIETVGRYSLVEAIPHTGRLHQIRRHLKRLSCPLIGDVRYGKGEHNRVFRSQHGLHRLALHAHSLSFEHPDTGEQLRVQAALPSELDEALSSAGFSAHCSEPSASAGSKP
ncbi:MAG: pseudouridylate synthase [Deltaproteobacteria bacterium]|nr:pseudouridylate synthase [Deltaproteobacteria bacterium]